MTLRALLLRAARRVAVAWCGCALAGLVLAVFPPSVRVVS